MLRNDSRRDTDSANNFDISSRRSMIDTFLREAKRIVFLAAVSFATVATATKAAEPLGAVIATRAAVGGVILERDTSSAAICTARPAIAAGSLDANRRRSGADVSASPAVVRI